MKKKEEILKGAQEVFFEALLIGYANQENSYYEISPLDGAKFFRFVNDEFTVIDRWYSNFDSKKSFGSTIILYEGSPVWSMSYGGLYFKNVISFLKFVLNNTYRKKEFLGGRGPIFLKRDKFVYLNNVIKNEFSDFMGKEKIVDSIEMKTIGYYWYRGVSLI